MDISRRHCLALGMGATLGGLLPVPAPAQSVSPARREASALPLPTPGSPLALPSLTLLDGSRFDARAADGHVLLIYWWASWCPFCAVQSPYMQSFWQAQRGNGLLMLALSIDKTPQAAASYLSKKGYTFPAGWADDAVQSVMPKPKGLPITLVRGRDGNVLQAENGQLFPEDVQELGRWLTPG